MANGDAAWWTEDPCPILPNLTVDILRLRVIGGMPDADRRVNVTRSCAPLLGIYPSLRFPRNSV